MDLLGHPLTHLGLLSADCILHHDKGLLSLPCCAIHTWLYLRWNLSNRTDPLRPPHLVTLWPNLDPLSWLPRILLLVAFCRQIHKYIPSRFFLLISGLSLSLPFRYGKFLSNNYCHTHHFLRANYVPSLVIDALPHFVRFRTLLHFIL